MARLLQGDVGSGKTAVAAAALVIAAANGYQGALMAPTEILAEQHYRTLTRLLEQLEVESRRPRRMRRRAARRARQTAGTKRGAGRSGGERARSTSSSARTR